MTADGFDWSRRDSEPDDSGDLRWLDYHDVSGDTLRVEVWGTGLGDTTEPVIAIRACRTDNSGQGRTVCVKLEDMAELIGELMEVTVRARSARRPAGPVMR